MDVHHHSHASDPESHRGRKKWTHHIWEFFMLFLAVTLGFFVENQREHFVELKREKEYIRSMIEDLRFDTAGFALDSNMRSQAISMYDSAIILLNKEIRTQFDQQRLYYLARMSVRLSPFPKLNDRTYEQMKSSGNLRLIHDNTIADQITKYYFNSKEFSLNIDQTLLRLQSMIEYQGKIFNATVFEKMLDLKQFWINPPDGHPALLTGDKIILNELAVRTHYTLSIISYSQRYIADLNAEAAQLIEALKKEYHLK